MLVNPVADPNPASLETQSTTLAAVDLGSNSFHLVVAKAGPERLAVVDRLREPVRLAESLKDGGKLAEAAMRRGLECLERFGERLRSLPAENVRVVGTNALRKSKNAADFIGRAEQVLGHPIEVVSGIEEARLIHLGVSRDFPAEGGRRLVIDIGGGSTELIIGEQSRPVLLESIYLGCVSLSERIFTDGRITRRRMRNAVLEARQALEPVNQSFLRAGWTQAIGASGTVTVAEALIEELGLGGPGITLATLDELIEQTMRLGTIKALVDLPGVRSDRAQVLPGGLAILRALFEDLQIEALQSSQSAMREGLLIDLHGRIRHLDAREETVVQLAERYHVDRDHAARVAASALNSLAQVSDAWELHEPWMEQLLQWGARLHEVGLSIAHAQYHKHGAYILEHADLPGFSRNEQRMLATLVRCHRRKFRKDELKLFAEPTALVLTRLCILLRLAVVMHRGRHGGPLPKYRLTVEGDGKTLRLEFPDGWLDDHALTRADLMQEATLLRPSGIKLKLA